jgi:hypothetical protein
MMADMIRPSAPGPLTDPKVLAVIDRLQAERRRPTSGGPRHSGDLDPHAYEEFGFSIHPEQGDLIYLLCRAIGARWVVEFATSIGMSTLYFAATIRDNGGGTVIGSDVVPGKLAAASAISPLPVWPPGSICARAMRGRPCAISAGRSMSPSSTAGRAGRVPRWRAK